MKLQKLFCILVTLFCLTGCYSVFSGGTGGVVVDAESTSTPKLGIANVDVYAYTSEKDCNEDFNSWTEGTTFTPKAEYYGHTTTSGDGSFSISRLVWKKNPAKSTFGRDADTQKIYLLYFHENYGLNKGETIIVSDSTSDTVYEELTAVRKSTNVVLNFTDVATNRQPDIPLFVQITVPQTTATNTQAKSIVYKQTVVGSGTIRVSYPRWQSDDDKTNGKETTPSILIQYYHSAETPEWAGCYNGDNSAKDWSFRADAKTGISKTIQSDTFTVNLWGKATRINMPSISGQYDGTSSADDDGKILSLKRKNTADTYDIDCGEVTTGSQTIGSSGTQNHGVFTGLGAGYFWYDTSYTEKYVNIDVKIFEGSTEKLTLQLRSDVSNYTVQINS